MIVNILYYQGQLRSEFNTLFGISSGQTDLAICTVDNDWQIFGFRKKELAWWEIYSYTQEKVINFIGKLEL